MTNREKVIEVINASELNKATWEAGGLELDDDFLEYPEDFYGANSGAVPGMIYYSDTEAFAKENLLKIITSLWDYEEELGEPLQKPSENRLNWLAWFAWENLMSQIIRAIED